MISGACTQSNDQDLTVTPLKVPQEGIHGEYVEVIIQLSSILPCKIILAAPYKTAIENYFSPYSTETCIFPNSDGTVVFHEQIPWETVPGDYILKVLQKEDDDTEYFEIFSQTFIVR